MKYVPESDFEYAFVTMMNKFIFGHEFVLKGMYIEALAKWTERNGKYLKRHSEVTEQLKALDAERSERVNKVKTMRLFVKRLKEGGKAITQWNEELWSAVIDCVVVGVDGSMTFRFKNGTEVVE